VLRDKNVSYLRYFSTLAHCLFSRSSKYQSSHCKEIINAAGTTEMNGDHHRKSFEQTTGTEYETEIHVLPMVSKELQITTRSGEACSKDPVRNKELEIQEKQKQSDDSPLLGDTSVLQQESDILRNKASEEHQIGGLIASDAHALEEEDRLRKTEDTDEKVEEPMQKTKSSAVVPPEKVRRFTLDRLKQLGVDISIKPRLGADKDSFVILDEPETNRGNPLNCGESPWGALSCQLLIICYCEGQGTWEKPITTHLTL
jgi:hypothetical protein